MNLFEIRKDNDAIFVVVDCLSKQTYFVPKKTMAMAREINQLFIKYMYILHGLLKKIIFDKISKFLNTFSIVIFKALSIKLCFNTTYHL
jgi:hypothetical protein